MAAALLRQTSYADFRITVRNQSAVIANLRRLSAAMDEEVTDLVQEWGERIRDKAIELAPIGKDTDPAPHPGFLKRHIHVLFSDNYRSFEVGCWAEDFDAIGENLYAIFQEYGTSFHDAQPFLNPSYEWGRPLFVEDLTEMLKRLARSHGGPGSG